LPEHFEKYAGVMICLARQENPDQTNYDDPEVVCQLQKKHHAGLIVASEEQGRIEQLLDDFRCRFEHDFLATAPPLDEAPN
jgi:hypothetical protein